MFKKTLLIMREKIRMRAYVMTVHAEEERINDDLSITDIEHALLTGEITERQKDVKTGELKYAVLGDASSGNSITMIVKLSKTGKLVFITVFRI